jgi:hypothetical protein
LSKFGASFLIPLSGFMEGQTILFSMFLDVLLLEKVGNFLELEEWFN